MIVHFTSSKQNIKEEYQNLSKIAGIIKGFGHTFAREWWDEEYERAQTGHAASELDWKKINKDNMGALARADVIIIEATAKTFSVGFQLATAIQQKKPTLVLMRGNSLAGSFGEGVSSDFVQFADYDDENVDKTIGKFLEVNTIDTKDMRFNFFINRTIYNYLRWASFQTGKTKAEILRQLIEREIKDKAE